MVRKCLWHDLIKFELYLNKIKAHFIRKNGVQDSFSLFDYSYRNAFFEMALNTSNFGITEFCGWLNENVM